MSDVMRLRRGTSAAWALANPILEEARQGYDTTLKKHKIGDGVTHWNNLPFQGNAFREFTFILHREENATLGINKTNALIVSTPMTITNCYAYAKTAPVGSSFICDINVDGTTIWTTQENRITIVNGAHSGTQTNFNTTSLAAGSILTIDIDQIGSSVAGSDITIVLKCTIN